MSAVFEWNNFFFFLFFLDQIKITYAFLRPHRSSFGPLWKWKFWCRRGWITEKKEWQTSIVTLFTSPGWLRHIVKAAALRYGDPTVPKAFESTFYSAHCHVIASLLWSSKIFSTERYQFLSLKRRSLSAHRWEFIWKLRGSLSMKAGNPYRNVSTGIVQEKH